ncbi:hypothetical protein [Enterococcus sp. HY326]|uniref:hypothetical protein n=1 Tax=Enterococcus sp. HY326 TaxID=2971265 RepID=UPI0022409CB4|nr:hypothetical protein [Enterococcus sp. HY326]
MTVAQQDFDYYQRTIQEMYQNYYWKRIAITLIAFVLILLYTIIFRESLILNAVLLIGLAAIAVYLFNAKQKFSEVFENFLAENTPDLKIQTIQEDEYAYNVMENGEQVIRVNKNGVRNLPSSEKQYTMMVGFAKTFFSQEPLQIIYYDMLEITYEEKFRLKRNGYNSMPRFLRRFSFSNLKAGVGNIFSFVLGNIFVLFIVFRLVRYIIAMFRNFL